MDRTGVEMEALTAAAVAALSPVRHGEGVRPRGADRGLRLLAKSGGKSGDYRARLSLTSAPCVTDAAHRTAL